MNQDGPSAFGGSDPAGSRSKVRRVRSAHGEPAGAQNVPPQPSARRPAEGWGVCAGTLIRVSMRNFMCHQSFVYCPHPRLNFLSGVNGSGKSAVLTAITFALGASARTAGRGTSARGFVRTGAPSATVEVTLSNAGEYAYRSDIYGSAITIARRVTVSGSGAYQLKDEHGVAVSEFKVREELERILASFRIEVDNPIALLNQDTAKTFLFKCDPHKLYQFFMRSTQLDACRRDYNEAAQERAVAESILEDKKDGLPTLSAQVQLWHQKLQLVEDLESRGKTLRRKREELAWAVAQEAKATLNTHLENVQRLAIKAEKSQELGQSQVVRQKELKKKKVAIEGEIQSLANSRQARAQVIDGLKEEFDRHRTAEAKQRATTQGIQSQIAAKQGDVRSLEDEITRLKDRGDAEFQGKIRERSRQLEVMVQEIAALEDQAKATEEHLLNLNHNHDQLQSQTFEKKAEVTKREIALTHKTKELEAVGDKNGNRLAAFGPGMPKLVDSIIKAKSKFNQAPIGPLGAYIQFKTHVSDEIKLIVENELRPVMSAFVVDSFKDKKSLESMMKTAGVRGQIITTKFRHDKYDLGPGICHHPQFKTILELVEITNPTAFNVIVDQRHIEKILIFPSDVEAQELLKSRSTVPPNCMYGLTLTRNQYFPAPSYQTYTTSGHRNNSILQCNVKELVKTLKKEVDELQVRLTEAREHMAEVQSSLKESEREKQRTQKVITKVNCELKGHRVSQSRLKTEAETDKPPDISALEEDRDRLAQEVENLQKEIGSQEKRLDQLSSSAKEARERLSKAKEEHEGVFGGADSLCDALTSVEDQIVKTERDKDHYKAKHDEYLLKISDLQSKLEELKESYNERFALAEKHSPEPPPIKIKPERLQREICSLEENLRRQEVVSQSRDEVLQNLERCRAVFQEARTIVETRKDTVSKLKSMLSTRKRGFHKIRMSIMRRVQNYFVVRLATRNYTGEILFDPKEQTMELVVCPDGADPETGRRSMKTLSGGEKSYSTISLVLSLWDVMSPPFRILDEFDVFMDMVNRRASLQQIVEYAKMKRNYQYIFLTPLNMDCIEVDEDLNIIRLEKSLD